MTAPRRPGIPDDVLARIHAAADQSAATAPPLTDREIAALLPLTRPKATVASGGKRRRAA